MPRWIKCHLPRFLSTLSLRRATRRSSKTGRHFPYFYPRSPCGERRLTYRWTQRFPDISIHALLAESDTPRLSRVVPTPIFLSTLSLRRATEPTAFRTPHQRFLSTLSLRRATPETVPRRPHAYISIHALLAESDYRAARPDRQRKRFLSTLSLRRATDINVKDATARRFLSTLSLRRATCRQQGRRRIF